MRVAATVLCLVLSGCAGAPTSTPATPEPTTSAHDDRLGLPVGPPPRVGYVDDQVHVAPDGTRTRVQRGRHVGIVQVARTADGALLVRDGDNLEAYSTVRLVRPGRTVGRWSVYGAVVAGRDGTLAFGEATFSEASVLGPIALHLLTDRRHLVQSLPQRPGIRSVVDGRVVFTFDYSPDEDLGPFVTDLESPPRHWHGPLPERPSSGESRREPDGSVLRVEGTTARSAIVRTRPDGTRELATALRGWRPEGIGWSPYCLEMAFPS